MSMTNKKSTKSIKVVSIELTRVLNADQADRIKLALHGKSYMTLQVLVCPAGGEFQVSVQTLRPRTTKAELTGMVMMLLCDALPKI